MIISIILVIIFYIIPTGINLWWIITSHSKNGLYYPLKPTKLDWEIVFIPVLNIYALQYTLFNSPKP